jgi:hypothetical protein
MSHSRVAIPTNLRWNRLGHEQVGYKRMCARFTLRRRLNLILK